MSIIKDKIGLTSAMARARVGGSSSLISTGDGAPIAAPSIPVADPDDLPADIFTKEVNLKYSNLTPVCIFCFIFSCNNNVFVYCFSN